MGYDPEKLILPNEVGWADLPCPTEEQEQAYVIQWCELMRPELPELELLFHIPNGGMRSKTEAVRFKRIGVKPGVPDLFLPVARGKFHGLFIEMKRKKGGRPSAEQSGWIKRLKNEGYAAYIAQGGEEAVKILGDYLKRQK